MGHPRRRYFIAVNLSLHAMCPYISFLSSAQHDQSVCLPICQVSLSQCESLTAAGSGVSLLQDLTGFLRRSLTHQAPVQEALYMVRLYSTSVSLFVCLQPSQDEYNSLGAMMNPLNSRTIVRQAGHAQHCQCRPSGTQCSSGTAVTKNVRVLPAGPHLASDVSRKVRKPAGEHCS